MSKVDQYKAYAAQLVRNPDDATALVDQFAIISVKKENAQYYLPLASRAYEIEPNNISCVFNYGSALHRAGEFDDALKMWQKCLPMAKDEWLVKVLHHIGIGYRALNRNEQAAEYYLKAHALDPNPQFLKDRAIALMAAGKLNEGLQAFEVRREVAMIKFAENRGDLVSQQKLPDGVVHWQGEDLTDKTVVVYHEEGSGDFIQFCRFIPKLREKGVAKILLCGPVPDLLDLVADNIAVDGIVPLAGPFECDFVLGSMSLPWRCGIELDNVRGGHYFKSEMANIPLRGKLNVGLVWRGNPTYGMDVHRSMDFREFCPLFDMPGIVFYSLQAGPPSLEVTNLGLDGFVANLEPLAKTWRDTAKLIQRLDVIVSVDTACAHLAGALGKPVFILTTAASDWRWNRNSSKTVWYDSATVVRQKKQGDWQPGIMTVRSKLKEMLRGKRAMAA